MKNKLLPILIILITFAAAAQLSFIPILKFIFNTFFNWGLFITTIITVLWYKKKYFHPSNKKDYRIVNIYFVWMIIGIVRGCFVAENYWEWKQLIEGSLTLSVPIFTYVLGMSYLLQDTLRYWIKYALWAFILFFIWTIAPGAYHYYLGPILLLSCFIPILPKNYKILFIILLLIMCFIALGARSQVIKAIFTLGLGLGLYFKKNITTKTFKVAHFALYIFPIILLYLGISGVFNLFQDLSKNEGKYVEKRYINGELMEEDLSVDTRTFIYEEVIASALRHNYVLFGRTPARGNDSMTFGAFNAEELKTGRYERHSNEVCHPNIFTWLGLIGMILYSCIYFKSSYLAVYQSNNIFMKLLGVFIAFRWAYGWIEDFNRFDISNISLWMIIAMGFSEQFRKMNNLEFKQWVVGIFKK